MLGPQAGKKKLPKRLSTKVRPQAFAEGNKKCATTVQVAMAKMAFSFITCPD